MAERRESPTRTDIGGPGSPLTRPEGPVGLPYPLAEPLDTVMTAPDRLLEEEHAPPLRRPERRAEPTSIEQVRADLDRARADVLDALDALRLRVRHQIDWRMRVRARPGVALMVAFAAGYVLGRVV